MIIKSSLVSLLSVAVLGLALAACTPQALRAQDPQLVAAPDRTSAMLAEAADKASNALQTLAAIEQAKSPAVNMARLENAPVELRRAVTVSWIGPVEKITKTLADRASYTFEVLGDQPPVPVVVNINATNKPIVDILRDIGLQLGTRANVRVDSNRHVVELHYAPVTATTEG